MRVPSGALHALRPADRSRQVGTPSNEDEKMNMSVSWHKEIRGDSIGQQASSAVLVPSEISELTVTVPRYWKPRPNSPYQEILGEVISLSVIIFAICNSTRGD